jgi:negative regulator of flagellin synthesis FlgM
MDGFGTAMLDQVSGGGLPQRAAALLAGSGQASNGKVRVDAGAAPEAGTSRRVAPITAPITAPAAQLSPAARELAAAPPVDSSRVEALRARISEGCYPIDADAIASAMIRSELSTSQR